MEQKDLRLTNALLGILVMFALGALLQALQSVLLPFVLAIFLSYIFKPVMLHLKNVRVPSALALIVVLILISGLFFGLGAIIYSSIHSFVQEAPKYEEKLTLIVRDLTIMIDDISARFGIKPENVNLTDLVDVSSLTGLITSGAGSFFSGVGNFLLVILLMSFILAGSGNMSAKVRLALAARHSDRLAAIIEGVDV